MTPTFDTNPVLMIRLVLLFIGVSLEVGTIFLTPTVWYEAWLTPISVGVKS